LAGRYGVDFDPFATPPGNVCYLREPDRLESTLSGHLLIASYVDL
jgi:hypothetical protein